MQRLTVNKPVSEMSMEELAYNCCYVSEDGSASYRDFQVDIDAREFAKKLMRIYGDEDLLEDDTELDEELMEELKYDPEIYPSALIALFYRNLWAMAQLHNRLKYYEDAEEQGLILRLPVAIGQTVYTNRSMRGWYCRSNNRPYEAEVVYIGLNKSEELGGRYINIDFKEKRGCMLSFTFNEIGLTIFLTKEEAEQKLAEMG